ncbi:MAG TPA: SnoaL-like domain-containing protein [Puia sp.]|nr:SnoaL-like domain-containing protein [Puia sp.]
MTTQELATRYRELMTERKFLEIQDTFYAEDVVCQEMEKATAMGLAVITHGLEAIKAKGIARRATIETIHSYYCSEPLVAGDFFSVVLRQDLTFKGRPRTTVEEIAIFQTKDGKVVKEQFFY